MGQRRMDKPPTKAKPSAQDAEAQELTERLRQLADDYAARFHRSPNREDLRMARKLRELSRPDLLLPETELIPIGEPEGRSFLVRETPDRFIRVPGKRVNEILKTPHRNTWERETWVKIIPDAIEGRDGDPEAVARDLILWMPASLRAECPGYPTDRDAFDAAAVAVARKIKDQVQIGIVGRWRPPVEPVTW